MAKLLQGAELQRRLDELGVDVGAESRPDGLIGRLVRAPDHELQWRVVEAERAIRESRLWLLAFVSAIASVASAIAAILAVIHK